MDLTLSRSLVLSTISHSFNILSVYYFSLFTDSFASYKLDRTFCFESFYYSYFQYWKLYIKFAFITQTYHIRTVHTHTHPHSREGKKTKIKSFKYHLLESNQSHWFHIHSFISFFVGFSCFFSYFSPEIVVQGAAFCSLIWLNYLDISHTSINTQIIQNYEVNETNI